MNTMKKSIKSVFLSEIIEKLNLTPLNKLEEDIEIFNSGIYRVGYEFAGFFQCELDELHNCIHIIGKKESLYLRKLPKDIREITLKKYFSYPFPLIIASCDSGISDEFLYYAKKNRKVVLKSDLKTVETIRELKFYLSKILGEELIMNGYVLLEIEGVGVLLTGDNDVKVGVTVELLERGHKFITDNNILVRKDEMNNLIGFNMLNNVLDKVDFFLESNGKKIDITNHFGIKSTRTNKRIDIIIELERWQEDKFYDRLGLDEFYEKILDVNTPKITLPVKKGRNLAVIIEAGAMNCRLKKMGVNSAQYFWTESKKLIRENKMKRDDKSKEVTGLPLRKLINKFDLEVIVGEEHIDEKRIKISNIHKPSLALSGYFDMYEEEGYNGIQIFSEVEFNFLENKINENERERNLRRYLSYDFPLIIVTSDVKVPDYFIKKVKEFNLVLARTNLKRSAQVVAIYNSYLEYKFAPSISMHGVFVELHGFGVLLTGKSGIGKSETALELIHRGHRLVADDVVKFTKDPAGDIIGKADKIPYFMEVRGLGIIDVKTLYGLGAVRIDKRLDIIIELQESLTNEEYLTEMEYSQKIDVIGVSFDKVLLYISSGRNAAAMVEIAVMNLMAKKLGYDSEKAYKEGISRLSLDDKERLGIH